MIGSYLARLSISRAESGAISRHPPGAPCGPDATTDPRSLGPRGDEAARPTGGTRRFVEPRGGRRERRPPERPYRKSERTPCGSWFAWARIEVPAWERMLLRVNATISCAMSASRIRLSEAARFSERGRQVLDRVLEPVLDRTEGRAVGRDVRDRVVERLDQRLGVAGGRGARERRHRRRQVGEAAAQRRTQPSCRRSSAFDSALSMATETVWLAFAPTWNEAEDEPAAVTMLSLRRRRSGR